MTPTDTVALENLVRLWQQQFESNKQNLKNASKKISTAPLAHCERIASWTSTGTTCLIPQKDSG